MKKWLILASLVLTMGLLAACGASDNDSNNGESKDTGKDTAKKTLVMGTSADYPPFESTDTTKGNDIVGFDIDIAKYLTDQLGYNLKIQNMDFKGLIAALNTQRVDFVMAGMSATEERKKSVDFTDVYYNSQQLIMTRKDTNIKSVDDLKGKTVGAQLGSIQEDLAKKINKKVSIKIKTRDKMNILVEELKSKRLDAVVIEDAAAANYFNVDKNLEGFVIPDSNTAGSAIAFPKDSELTSEFNDALKKMKDSGKMDELVQKWFKISNNNQ